MASYRVPKLSFVSAEIRLNSTIITTAMIVNITATLFPSAANVTPKFTSESSTDRGRIRGPSPDGRYATNARPTFR